MFRLLASRDFDVLLFVLVTCMLAEPQAAFREIYI